MQSLIRNLALMLVFIGAAACAPTAVQTQYPTPSAQLSGDYFVTTDETRLPMRQWQPSGDVAAIIVAVHGFNDYSNFIATSAPQLAAAGIAIYAYDQRGFGNTATRGSWQGDDRMGRDLLEVVTLAKTIHQGKPIFVLGESMGGAVSVRALTFLGAPRVNGLILSAPAIVPNSYAPPFMRKILDWGARTVPWLKLFNPSSDTKSTDNEAILEQLLSDPAIIREPRIEALHGVTELMFDSFERLERLSLPVLALYGDRDPILPSKAPTWMESELGSNAKVDLKLIRYRDGYHLLLRDRQAANVRRDIIGWVLGRKLAVNQPRQADRLEASPSVPSLVGIGQPRFQ